MTMSRAVGWAQEYARRNREVMMAAVIAAARGVIGKPFSVDEHAVNCHHNYVQRERHFDTDVYVTRKGAVSAQKGTRNHSGVDGTRSFIVRPGNPESFCSCSHGAGRTMSRTEAKRRFTVADESHRACGCPKDEAVIDEIPMAYKDIDAVMAAQRSPVEIVHTLRRWCA